MLSGSGAEWGAARGCRRLGWGAAVTAAPTAPARVLHSHTWAKVATGIYHLLQKAVSPASAGRAG